MPRDIRTIGFTVFDLETTGLDPDSGDRVIEIAAVKLRNKQRLGIFQYLINPGERRVSPAAFAVNQIDLQMLKDSPTISEVIPLFFDFISGTCLVSYNASFDFAFLSSELRIIKKQIPAGLEIIDILAMARMMLPGLGRYALGFVANHLGIDTAQKHRALSDAQLAADVFNRLSSSLIKRGIVDFEQFASLFGLSSQFLDNINNAKIARIQRALDLGVSLKIKYLSRHNAELTEREVIPRAIIQQKNQAYLVGYCNLRNQERTFGIKNILHLEMGIPVKSS